MTTRRPPLSFDSALSHDAADKRIDILRLIGDSGSISQAARDAGVSYKAAWQAVDTLTNLAGVALVERAVGGSGGGGATLTPEGRQLLLVAQVLDEARAQVFASLRASTAAFPVLAGIGLRTSMRNQLPCHVGQLETRGQVVRAHLVLAGGATLVSRITRASAELLGLKKGQPVLALCKATAVTVTRAGDVGAAGQRLSGRATRISRGASGDEVSLQLDAGLQLVGFAAARSGLRSGAGVAALVDEAAVVVALSP
ncbi:MAG: LysR family transcriptional regulator [Polaromonas sp.]|nr:LysR family transcriptional regulator [Polaromonas sp.]